MPLATDTIQFEVLASDPSTPVEGEMWYNTTEKAFKTYQGGAVQTTNAKNKLDATVDPTVNEDSGDGYSIGSRWINTSSDEEYVCLDSTVAAAVWKGTTSGGSTPASTPLASGAHMLVDADGAYDEPFFPGIPTHGKHWPWKDGKVFTVDKSGLADYTTISAAITNASDGDVILVAPGLYPEELVVDRDVAIVGLTPPTYNYDAATPACVVLNPTLTVTAARAVQVTSAAALVVFQNIRFAHIHQVTASENTYGIYMLTGSGKTLFDRCIIAPEISATAGAATFCYGVFTAASAKPDFYDCEIAIDDPLNIITSGDGDPLTVAGTGVVARLFTTRIKSGQNWFGDVNILTNGTLEMVSSIIEGTLKDNGTGGNVYLDGASRINAVDTGDYSDDDTQTKLVQRSYGLADTGGQKSLYKLNLRSLTGAPISVADGNIWYDSILTKLRAREHGDVANLRDVRTGAVKPVRCASTVNVPTISGLLVIDGVTTVSGDRVLLKNQSTASQNGVYVAAAGAWSYCSDCWTSDLVVSQVSVVVAEGTSNARSEWILLTTGAITVGVTSLSFGRRMSNNVWTVSANGGAQFTTIQAAVNATGNSSDIILVYPGQYPEKVVVTSKGAGFLITSLHQATLEMFGVSNTDSAVTITPTLAAGEIALDLVQGSVRGIYVKASAIGIAGSATAIRCQSGTIKACLAELTVSGASTVGPFYAVQVTGAVGNKGLSDVRCNIVGTPGSGTRRALYVDQSNPTRIFRLQTTASGDVELNTASSVQFAESLIVGDLVVTAAGGGVFLDTTTKVTGTVTGMPSSATIDGNAVNGVVWYDFNSKQITAREGGRNVPLFNPPQGLHMLAEGGAGEDGPPGPPGPQGPQGPPGGTSAGGSNTQVQYNNGGVLAGDADLTWDAANNKLGINGDVIFTSIATPTTPAAGKLSLFARTMANRVTASVIGPSGVSYPLQSGLFANAVMMFLPSTGTAITNWGMSSTIVGTASHPTLANTNFLTAMRRTRFASSTTAGSFAGLRGTALVVWRGNAAGLGGFFFGCRFSMTTTLANARAFVGLYSATGAMANADPSTLLNICGMGLDSASANWYVCTNDAAGAATTTDLGASFVKSATAVYELRMFCAPNSSEVYWQVDRLDSAATQSGTFLNTNLPQNTVFLNPYIWITNNATAAAAQIEFARLYLESDV